MGVRGINRPTLAQRMAKLSADDLLKRLPDVPTGLRQHYEAQALFRQLGELLGEEALDEIVRRYRMEEDEATNQFVVRAMGWALAGWMKKDVEGASQALRQLQRSLKDNVQENTESVFDWKGTQLTLSGDSSFAIAHIELMRPGLQAATEADSEVGLELIRQMPGATGYLSLYTSSLSRSTDWAAVDAQLRALDWGSSTLVTSGQDSITRAVASGWVKWDVEGALDWFLERNTDSGSGRISLALQILSSVSDPLQAVEWLREHEGTDTEIDRFLEGYSQTLWPKETANELHRIIGIPSQEAVRDRILTRFARPRKGGEEGMEVWFPPETLHSLITAARLSPESEKRWRDAVDENSVLPVVWGE